MSARRALPGTTITRLAARTRAVCIELIADPELGEWNGHRLCSWSTPWRTPAGRTAGDALDHAQTFGHAVRIETETARLIEPAGR